MTRTTTVIWGSDEDRLDQRMQDEGRVKITEMMADGKVEQNGLSIKISDTHFIRFWRDQEAAEEFTAWMWSTAEKYNIKIVSIEYGDIGPSAGQFPGPRVGVTAPSA